MRLIIRLTVYEIYSIWDLLYMRLTVYETYGILDLQYIYSI